jgi:hypothetical protein
MSKEFRTVVMEDTDRVRVSTEPGVMEKRPCGRSCRLFAFDIVESNFKKVGNRINHHEGLESKGLTTLSFKGPRTNRIKMDFLPGDSRGITRSKSTILLGRLYRLFKNSRSVTGGRRW